MKNQKPELITAPCLLFEQKDGEGLHEESPILVQYWNGSVELKQDDDSIIIRGDKLKALMKAITENHKEGQEFWDNK